MPADASAWNARYRDADQNALASPASLTREWLPMLPKGRALDLACGSGRHSLLLASRPQSVTAVDWSSEGLSQLTKRAQSSGLRLRRVANLGVAAGESGLGIQLVQADLQHVKLPASAFALILCIQFLLRPLFSQMEQALRPGGVLLFETYTRAQLNIAGGPRNPAHLLEEGELRSAFPGLHVLFYRELCAGQGIASLVAQRPDELR